MTEFYFVRHGKTQFNLEGRFQGAKCDSPLLMQSIVDAKKVGVYLAQANLKFDAWYTSPLKRARKTGALIVDQLTQDLDEQLAFGLREIEFGDLDGKIVREYQTDPRVQAYLQVPSKYDANLTGGENYADFLRRVDETLKEIQSKYPHGKILVTSHGVLISFWVKSKMGMALDEIRPSGMVDNTSLTVVKTDDFHSFEVPIWNLTSYL